VEGDKQSDIFDGLAVESKQPTQVRYVPGEQVAAIYPGEVTLKIASADIGTLEPFQAPPHEVASGKGASRDSDVELATGKALEPSSARPASPSLKAQLRPSEPDPGFH
jgi:hypothetical protein